MARTEVEIQTAINNIRAELQKLPEVNAFGESNEDDAAALQAWLVGLQKAQAGQPSGEEVVDIWLEGRWSEIQDYCD